MVQGKIRQYHSSITYTNKHVKIGGLSRRDFIIYTSIIPLAVLSNNSDAVFQFLIPVAVRFFGRKIIKEGVKKIFTPRNISRPIVKTNTPKRKVEVEKFAGSDNSAGQIINDSLMLADQVWNQNKENISSTIISNPDSNAHDTGEIVVQLRDEDTANVDVQATIQPIDIPPRSQLLLHTKFSNLPDEGVKRIYGTYNGDQEAERSGRILIANNTYGMPISELYERYNRERGGELNPNISF